MPDAADLSRTSFLGLAFAQTWEGERYREPTNFQLLTVARILDKAIGDYQAARRSVANHDSMWENAGPAVRPRTRGYTVHLFRAIGRLEDLIAALDRLIRIQTVLHASADLAAFTSLPIPDTTAGTQVRNIRNRIAHGDEDIEAGKCGTVATLKPDATGVELQGHRLEFADLERWLRETHYYVGAITAATT